jgi:GNAT superfamily N-acetyltransferase
MPSHLIAPGELARRADENLFETFRVLARTAPRGEIRESDGLLLVATGAPVAMFNIAYVTHPLANPKSAVADAIEFFDARGLPFVLRVAEGVDSNTELAATSAGLNFTDAIPGMVLEDIGPRGTFLEHITIERVHGSNVAEHTHVVADSFGMPREIADMFVSEKLGDEHDFELYVGYHHDRPVASSALATSHRVAGIYNVGTIPEYRNRGLGEAMTWHAIRQGALAGCLVASLQASQMGEPIYRRMGFRTTTHYRTFTRPAP